MALHFDAFVAHDVTAGVDQLMEAQLMSTRRLARDEIGNRGLDIYEAQLRSKLAAIALDLFVAVDVETADYEVADEAHLASQRLRTRLPNSQIFIARIGHRAAFVAR